MDDRQKLEAIREWATTGIMKTPWPLGDGTAVMLRLRREVLAILEDRSPATQAISALAYVRERYGPALFQ